MSHHVNPLLGDAPPSEAALSRRGSMGLSSRGSGPGPCLMCAMALVFAVAMTALVLSVLVIVGTLPAGHLRTGPRGSQGANGANAIGSAFISTSVYDMNLTSTLHAVLGSDSLPLLFGFDANYALWVYHCGDYACSASSATLSRVIDPQRLPLVSAPLLRAAVGGDGLVYIVYQTDTVQVDTTSQDTPPSAAQATHSPHTCCVCVCVSCADSALPQFGLQLGAAH